MVIFRPHKCAAVFRGLRNFFSDCSEPTLNNLQCSAMMIGCSRICSHPYQATTSSYLHSLVLMMLSPHPYQPLRTVCYFRKFLQLKVRRAQEDKYSCTQTPNAATCGEKVNSCCAGEAFEWHVVYDLLWQQVRTVWQYFNLTRLVRLDICVISPVRLDRHFRNLTGPVR